MKLKDRFISIMCAKMLIYVAKKRPEILKAHIVEGASEMAPRIAMKMLERMGYQHCYRCPQTHELRKRKAGGYSCSIHAEEVRVATAA